MWLFTCARRRRLSAVPLVLALPIVLAGWAAIGASSSTVFRGDARSGHHTSVVTFRVTRRYVVDFQLDRLDVQQMTIHRDETFSGCNTREAVHPCVRGRLNRSRDRATGSVNFGRHGRWRYSARAIGIQSGS